MNNFSYIFKNKKEKIHHLTDNPNIIFDPFS